MVFDLGLHPFYWGLCLDTRGRLVYDNNITWLTGEEYWHYENTPIQIYCKFHLQKTANFQIKKTDIFHISAQNIDCGYSLEPLWRGSSNEYRQSLFSSRNKKNNVYPYKPQVYYIKVGFKGVKIIQASFRDDNYYSQNHSE